MARKLKVFRTSAGFSDAYVAAPSRKAALAAWGADADLFARGVAEEVRDPELMTEALARPGVVLTVSRGDLAAHLKALKGSARKPRPDAGAKWSPQAAPAKAPRKRERPPPTRSRLDAAEKALSDAEARYQADLRALERKRDAAERAIATLQAKADKALASLRSKRDTARRAYQEKLEAWSG